MTWGPKMDQGPDLDEPPPEAGEAETEADAWEYWHQRANRFEVALTQIIQRANERHGSGLMAERETVYAMHGIASAALKPGKEPSLTSAKCPP